MEVVPPSPPLPLLPEVGLTWLSCYGACCAAEEDAEMHPAVLSRVLHALEPQQGAEAASTVDGGLLLSHPTTSPLASVPAPTSEPAHERSVGASGAVTLDLSAIWMPLSGWLATLRSIATALPLRTLSLRDTGLGDAAARALCHHMATTTLASLSTPLLHTVNLSGAALTDAAPLAQLATACPHLRVLDLADNRLGTREDGLGVLCAALQLHPRLEVLSLRHNNISGSRDGLVLTAVAELIVGRSVMDSTGSHGGEARRPLRCLDLSENILGAYYLCRLGADDVSHDAVASFPLVTALFLTNTLVDLNLRGSGLPDALLDLVTARLHVNRRSSRYLDVAACAEGAVGSGTVRASLERRLKAALASLSHDAAPAPRGGEAARTATPTSATNATAAPASTAAERQWTSAEVADIVTCLVRGVATDLELY